MGELKRVPEVRKARYDLSAARWSRLALTRPTWWLNASRDAPACASSCWCCARVGARVNRNVTDLVSGTPVCETSGGCSAVSRFGVVVFGTNCIVPVATDNAHRAAGSGSARCEFPQQECRTRPGAQPRNGTRSLTRCVPIGGDCLAALRRHGRWRGGRWSRNGTWARALTVLHTAAREADGRPEPTPSMVVIDTRFARGIERRVHLSRPRGPLRPHEVREARGGRRRHRAPCRGAGCTGFHT